VDEYITQRRETRKQMHLQSIIHPHLKISSAKRLSLQARKSMRVANAKKGQQSEPVACIEKD
jgi:hypothetical protein